MHLATAILTCDRPTVTLPRTLRSLARAGFDLPWIFEGTPADRPSPINCTLAHLGLMRAALSRRPPGDGLLIFEDDVILCRGVAEYLGATAWPTWPGTVCLCSIYCPEAYCPEQYGTPPPTCRRWHVEDRGFYLAGSQAWIYPMDTLPAIVDGLSRRTITRGIDYEVGQLGQERGWSVWYHTPSLVQHVGQSCSAVGNGDCGTIYHAMDFPGEEFDARSLL